MSLQAECAKQPIAAKSFLACFYLSKQSLRHYLFHIEGINTYRTGHYPDLLLLLGFFNTPSDEQKLKAYMKLVILAFLSIHISFLSMNSKILFIHHMNCSFFFLVEQPPLRKWAGGKNYANGLFSLWWVILSCACKCACVRMHAWSCVCVHMVCGIISKQICFRLTDLQWRLSEEKKMMETEGEKTDVKLFQINFDIKQLEKKFSLHVHVLLLSLHLYLCGFYFLCKSNVR